MEKLSAPIFNSRIKSDTVTKAEKWLGYLIGPAGVFVKRKMGHKASEKWANWGKKKSGLSEKPVFFS